LKRRIVLLGPPASGKGTQAERIATRYGIPSASTGAMLREERSRGSALGREAEAWTAAGRLFPDEMALRVVRHWLDVHGSESFLFDGFPRTLGQARAFDDELSKINVKLDGVLHLRLSDDAIRARVASRITCTNCGATFSAILHQVTEGDACPDCGKRLERRGDDTMDALEERLTQHRALTLPAVEFYRASGRLTEFDAAEDRDVVFQKICEALEEVVPA